MCFKADAAAEETEFYEKRAVMTKTASDTNDTSHLPKNGVTACSDGEIHDIDLKSMARSATHGPTLSRATTPGLDRHLSLSGSYFMTTMPESLSAVLAPLPAPNTVTQTSPEASLQDDAPCSSSNAHARRPSLTTLTRDGSCDLGKPGPSDHKLSESLDILSRIERIPDTVQSQLDELERQVLAQKPHPSLTGIPGELRNEIYSYMDFFEGVICLHYPGAKGCTDYERLHKPAITRVCKLLRGETLPVYYTSNRVEMTCCWREGNRGQASCEEHHGGGNGAMEHGWLDSIMPHWDLIRDVKLRLPGWETWTRFEFMEERPNTDQYLCMVTSGLPLVSTRRALVQLLMDSYIHQPCKMGSAYFNGQDIGFFLRDVSDLVRKIECIAFAPGDRRMTSAPCWNADLEGFEVAWTGLNMVPGLQIQGYLEWDALFSHPIEDFVSETIQAGALLVKKRVHRNGCVCSGCKPRPRRFPY